MTVMLALSLSVSNLFAQANAASTPPALSTIQGISHELLRIITSENGGKTDWQSFKNLFLETSTLSVLQHGDHVKRPTRTMTINEFITLMGDGYSDKRFQGQQTGIAIQEYNGIANVFQSSKSQDAGGPVATGINSYQLVFFNDRWWISHLLYVSNANGVEVPNEYLDQH